MNGSASDGIVTLRSGLWVPQAPISLLFELEGRGCRLSRDGDALVVEPAHLVSEDECRAIRRWKLHLLALVDYEAHHVQ